MIPMAVSWRMERNIVFFFFFFFCKHPEPADPFKLRVLHGAAVAPADFVESLDDLQPEKARLRNQPNVFGLML